MLHPRSHTRKVRILFLVLLAAVDLRAAGSLTVVSAATYRGGTLAAGSIASAFGAALGSDVFITDAAGNTQSSQVSYSSPKQVNFVIPADTAAGEATVKSGEAEGVVNIGKISPGLFAAAQQTLDPGPLELYGTGLRSAHSVSCLVGGIANAAVLYSGPAPLYNGLDQVNIQVPAYLSGAGKVDVECSADGQRSNAIPITITGQSAVDRGRQIVSQMTLDEKIASLHGIQDPTHYRTVPGVPRLNIPALNITNGPAGVTNGGPGHQGPATALPAPISLSATWDLDLARAYGVVIGRESKALANGFLEGPDINIARVPQNGRNFEASGEDPFLVGQISAAQIAGIQSQGVIAEAKHYAGNNQETNRGTINDLIDERTLREIYLPAFETSVKAGHAGAVMCAYNKVNGTYACENDLLMNQILKNEWLFDGFTTSDFGAVHSTAPSALAGLDVEMPTGIYFSDSLKAAVQAGTVPESMLDDKLVRRFATMMRFGIFDQPPVNSPLPLEADGAIGRQIASAGMVLLKNDSAILPLDPARVHSIALIGPYATKAKTGGGGSSLVVPAYTVDLPAALQARGFAVSVNDGRNTSTAVAMAQAADAVIIMLGDDEAEGADHAIALSGNQDSLAPLVTAAARNSIVVVKSGAPVLMPWASVAPAILQAWYPGEEEGNALADVLFGDVNPSGKLPQTFPVQVADLPANTSDQYPGVNLVANYSEGVFVGYRWFDAKKIAPLFPFGHGLSYTTFAYSNFATNGRNVDFDITNTGNRPGAEVAQVYVGLPNAPVPEPPIQLAGFSKAPLQPGETVHVHIVLDDRAFSYWDTATHAWVVAPGPYRIAVGSSSRDLRFDEQIQSR